MNLSEVNWDFESSGSWPLPVKIVTALLACSLVAGLWFHFLTEDQMDALASVEKKEVALKADFEKKQEKASNLAAYKARMKEMESSFGEMLRQLPDKTEIAKLLVDVSQTGLASGLEFELFQPSREVKKAFYAEMSIKIRVMGNYEEFGTFVSGLASLPQIVTIHNVKITPRRGGKVMTMDAIVKTYRYLTKNDTSRPKKGKRRGKR